MNEPECNLASAICNPTAAIVSEASKRVVLEYVEAFNRGDLDAVCRSFAPGALVYGVLVWGKVEAVRPVWNDLTQCSRMQLVVESMIVEDDTVAVRYSERGQSIGAFRGGPVTGQHYEVVAMEGYVLNVGRIERRWGARDVAARFRQMGLPLS